MTEGQLKQETFYGVSLTENTNSTPIVTAYQAVWLTTDDPAPKPPNLSGKVFYLRVDESSSTAVKKSMVTPIGAGGQHLFQLDWRLAEIVPKPLIQLKLQLARVYFRVCLPKVSNGFPTVVFYRSTWLGPDDPTPKEACQDNTAYYFLESGATYTTVTGLDLQNDGSDGHDKIRLGWIHDDNPPKLLIQKVDEQFRKDGFEQWPLVPNAYGLVDETTLREGTVSGDRIVADIEDRMFFMNPSSLESYNQTNLIPDLFVVEASVIIVQQKEYWRVDSVHRRAYADPTRQDLDKTSLLHLTRITNNKQVFLLSRCWIVEHCAQYADQLTRAIVNEMLKSELQIICDKARQRISVNLIGFTYRQENGFEWLSFEDYLELPWLVQLIGGAEYLDRNTFYRTVHLHSTSTVVKDFCINLAAITSVEEVEQHQFYSGLVAAIEQYLPSTESESFLYLFSLLGTHFLAGIPPGELPAADSDIPQLDSKKLEPVLLKRDSEHGKLGKFYTRVATVRALVRVYTVGDDFQVRIGEFKDDVTKSQLIDYSNNLLRDVLQSRTPLHERRLLQMIGVPCRQALGDIFHNRMSQGLQPIPIPNRGEKDSRSKNRTYQTRDDVVFKEVKKYVDLENDLKKIESLDQFQEFLSNTESIKSYNLLGKMLILQKIAYFNRSWTDSQVVLKSLKIIESILDDQGHYLAAELSRNLYGHSGMPFSKEETKEICKKWALAFWDEILECFPDVEPNWSQPQNIFNKLNPKPKDKSVNIFNKLKPKPKDKSVYTLFVLSSVFDRQITTFYEPLGKYIMPNDSIVWAVNSVHRLQMMSAFLPMCCGDWVCKHENKDVNSRRLWWDYSLAASAKPKSYTNEDSGERVPPQVASKFTGNTDHAEHKFTCISSECRHAPTESALWNIGKLLHLNEEVVNKVVQKIGWWFNGILDENLHHHFRCRKCQGLMSPDRESRNQNVFNCSKWKSEEGHDKSVTLIWCINPFCYEVIDSRDNLKKCDNGFYICKCGSCCNDHEKVKHKND